MVFMGDSLTAGYQLSLNQAFPALVEEKIRNQFPGRQIEVINAGVSGDTTAMALQRMPFTLKAHPQLAFVCLGANDALRGLDLKETAKNLTAIVTAFQQNGTRVALAGIDVPSNYGTEYRTAFKNIFVTLSREKQVPLLPFLLEGVALKPGYILSDGMHPNAEGHKIIAHTVFTFFTKQNLMSAFLAPLQAK